MMLRYRLSAVAACATVLTLTGCSSAAPAVPSTPSTPAAAATPAAPATPAAAPPGPATAAPTAPTARTAPPEAEPGGDVAFDATTDERWQIEWADLMMTDDQYELAIADAGDGRWAYIHTPTSCTIRFHQADASALDLTLRERELSDRMLAIELRTDADDIAANADDGTIPAQLSGDHTVAVRTVNAVNPDIGANYVVSARVFSGAAVGASVAVTCDEGVSATDVLHRIAPASIRLRAAPEA